MQNKEFEQYLKRYPESMPMLDVLEGLDIEDEKMKNGKDTVLARARKDIKRVITEGMILSLSKKEYFAQKTGEPRASVRVEVVTDGGDRHVLTENGQALKAMLHRLSLFADAQGIDDVMDRAQRAEGQRVTIDIRIPERGRKYFYLSDVAEAKQTEIVMPDIRSTIEAFCQQMTQLARLLEGRK